MPCREAARGKEVPWSPSKRIATAESTAPKMILGGREADGIGDGEGVGLFVDGGGICKCGTVIDAAAMGTGAVNGSPADCSICKVARTTGSRNACGFMVFVDDKDKIAPPVRKVPHSLLLPRPP